MKRRYRIVAVMRAGEQPLAGTFTKLGMRRWVAHHVAMRAATAPPDVEPTAIPIRVYDRDRLIEEL